ncbi:NHLP bacteriocin system secretion protein [Bosea sp. (in: a-proteobacteria)]|uniref:NHLP bacteriocin system secretion protein n=1 Tax=Bosea sp. (in: a-proteobacteria) TaxID=1871050 RepID=UPI0026269A80|nr:NHLP bacteriocin system secretion protein [Bosea sp. (in: a-proteobacteria)]MCO5089499.1 NHLP bacteriocin system secretion protein [Bosea sp. (in: a-proteobacteria)]
MSERSLFRSEAQAVLQRPDQLSSGLRLVNPGYLTAVVMLCALLLAAIAGAAYIKVPISITGTGVVLSSKGVLEFTIASQQDGRITDLLVDIGQRVEPGQEIARLTLPSLATDLKLAESELDLIRSEETRVLALQERSTALFETLRKQQEANARDTIQLLGQRRELLQQLADGQELLRKSGNTTSERYLRVHAELAEVLERSASKQGDLLSLTLNSAEKQAQYERELQALQSRRAQAQRQIERLSDRIRHDTVIRSTQHGLVSELKVLPGDLVRFDTPLISLLPVDESFAGIRPGGERLVAAILIPVKDGKKMRVGMPALVDPTSVRRDVYGAIKGTVSKTPQVAASPEYLRHILRNDDLVRKLTASGPPFLITVEMERDKSTQTGFRWTSSQGPDAQITAGTLLEAKIVIDHVSVLSLLLPALKDLVRGPPAAVQPI